jgi:sugar phosphate isomerase/epimerase
VELAVFLARRILKSRWITFNYVSNSTVARVDEMSKIPIALQLYSVREDCARDLAGTLKAVAEMGYDGVEFAGYYGWSADELRGLLDNVGLKVAGTHIGLDSLLGEALEETVEFNKKIGNKFLIVPWLPEDRRGSKVAWLETAQLMNEIAKKLKPHGLRVGYHNHTFEFQPVDGDLPWDILFSSTVPEVVMQLDTGNAMHGGVSPEGVLEILKRHPGRATTVHLKEFSASNELAVIGEGDMRWREFLKLCETIGGTEWYIIEQESYAYAPLECARRCIQNLKRMMQ